MGSPHVSLLPRSASLACLIHRLPMITANRRHDGAPTTALHRTVRPSVTLRHQSRTAPPVLPRMLPAQSESLLTRMRASKPVARLPSRRTGHHQEFTFPLSPLNIATIFVPPPQSYSPIIFHHVAPHLEPVIRCPPI
jgi:hypothetical protein